MEDAEVTVEGVRGVEELRGRAERDERGGDFAGDEAGFAGSGKDGAMAGFGGFGEDFGDAVEDFALGTLETVGELVEGVGFDADEVRWGEIGEVWRGVAHRVLDKLNASRAGRKNRQRPRRV